MTAASPPMLKPSVRLGLSILLVGHLVAIVAPPLAFQTRGQLGISPSVNLFLRPVEGYCQFLYMDRGYAFFAPDPGPSHLIQAAISDSSGETSEELFPDVEVQWPRLLYHRHFMITEYFADLYVPPGPPREFVESNRAEAEEWARARKRYEHVRASIIHHLEQANPGDQVSIRRIEHLVPNLIEFQRDPVSLTDERSYQVLLDDRDDTAMPGELTAPTGPPESIPAPSGQQPEASGADAGDLRPSGATPTPGPNGESPERDGEPRDPT